MKWRERKNSNLTKWMETGKTTSSPVEDLIWQNDQFIPQAVDIDIFERRDNAKRNPAFLFGTFIGEFVDGV